MRPSRSRRIRALLVPLSGAALAASLLAACGDGGEDPPAEGTTAAEESVPPEQTEQTEQATTGDGDDGSDDAAADDGTGDDASSDTETGDDGAAEDGGGSGDTNLFEGSWGFGHDTKVLSAEELADLLEEKAEELGPDEMSLDVECESGIDTGAGQTEADCTAFADEGVEHVWHVTAAPADAGLEVEVENAG